MTTRKRRGRHRERSGSTAPPRIGSGRAPSGIGSRPGGCGSRSSSWPSTSTGAPATSNGEADIKLIIDPRSLRAVAKRLAVSADGYAEQAKALRNDRMPAGMPPADVAFVRDQLGDIVRGLDRLKLRLDREAVDLEARAKKAEQFHANLSALKLTLPVIQPLHGSKLYQPFRGKLAVGDEGPQVQELQRRLRAAGFRPGQLDGKFGAKTQDAVKAFQKAHGLPVTGIVDRRTAEALGLQGERPGTGASSKAGFIWPTKVHVITSPFGPRWGRMHEGIDIGATSGQRIVASRGGKVIRASWFDAYGNTVDISHDGGYMTRYAHQSRMVAGLGQKIDQGELLGFVGGTGGNYAPHLHFEIHKGGPINPTSKLPR